MQLQKGFKPIPAKGSAVYGWHEMILGEYRSWPIADQDRLKQAASSYKRRNPGWNYTTRINGDTITVWRTA